MIVVVKRQYMSYEIKSGKTFRTDYFDGLQPF